MISRNENSGPLVSVLIPTYNRRRYVGEALKSVLCQTYQNFEILVVRDGGEEVADVVGAFDDRRIVFIDRAENRGKPYSLNQAIRMARGEYVCYLDDDDMYYPNHIEVLLGVLEGHDEYGGAYSDLYKVHYREEDDGSRTVLSKNVEVSRDFCREMLLHYNHILHVSFMHRRSLFEKTGLYNENINVMIDWDMTRRMAFFTDIKHVNEITGEYYAAIENSDRVSVTRRKNMSNYMWNLLAIRCTRPAKPWDKLDDLSMIVLSESLDERTNQQLLDIWSHSFYPHQIYLPASALELQGLETHVSNVIGVEVASTSSLEERFDAALKVCEGDYVVVVPNDLNLRGKDVGWVEDCLWPLSKSEDPNQAFEVSKSEPGCWSAVFRRDQIKRAREQFGHLSIKDSVKAAGIKFRAPKYEEVPFQFDNMIVAVEGLEEKGDWMNASKALDYIVDSFDGNIWVKTRYANSLYYSGKYKACLEQIGEVNRSRASVSSLLLEARAHSVMENKCKAIEFYRRAESILDGSEFAMAG